MPGTSPSATSRNAPPPTAVSTPNAMDITKPAPQEKALLAPATANKPTESASATNTP